MRGQAQRNREFVSFKFYFAKNRIFCKKIMCLDYFAKTTFYFLRITIENRSPGPYFKRIHTFCTSVLELMLISAPIFFAKTPPPGAFHLSPTATPEPYPSLPPSRYRQLPPSLSCSPLTPPLFSLTPRGHRLSPTWLLATALSLPRPPPHAMRIQ